MDGSEGAELQLRLGMVSDQVYLSIVVQKDGYGSKS